MGTDFSLSFAVHFSTSETAHHVFKTHWDKWEGALSAHRQGLWGAGGVTLHEDEQKFRVHPVSLLHSLLHQTQKNGAFVRPLATDVQTPQASLVNHVE